VSIIREINPWKLKSPKKYPKKTEVEKKEASSVGYNDSFASTPFAVSLICTYSQCSVFAVNFVFRSRRLGLWNIYM